jgi:hypothetical protein
MVSRLNGLGRGAGIDRIWAIRSAAKPIVNIEDRRFAGKVVRFCKKTGC